MSPWLPRLLSLTTSENHNNQRLGRGAAWRQMGDVTRAFRCQKTGYMDWNMAAITLDKLLPALFWDTFNHAFKIHEEEGSNDLFISSRYIVGVFGFAGSLMTSQEGTVPPRVIKNKSFMWWVAWTSCDPENSLFLNIIITLSHSLVLARFLVIFCIYFTFHSCREYV